jgi:hypothetical protein
LGYQPKRALARNFQSRGKLHGNNLATDVHEQLIPAKINFENGVAVAHIAAGSASSYALSG